MTTQNNKNLIIDDSSSLEDTSDEGEPPVANSLNELILQNTNLNFPNFDSSFFPYNSKIIFKKQTFPVNDKAVIFYEKYFPGTTIVDWSSWTWQLKNRIRTLSQLENIVNLTDSEREILEKKLFKKRVPISITPYYASLLDADDSSQPLRRAVVPVIDELHIAVEEASDPLAEDETRPVNGIIHRYPDRALFLVTNFCSVNCRYCTRSRVLDENYKQNVSMKSWEESINYLRKHTEIRDVVISGGDPLTLSDSQIKWLLSAISQISHVEIIRIGTKVPAVLPQRVTKRLVNILKAYKNLYMSLHFTHPDEITVETKAACNRLADIGIPLGSQTVLLKGINDNVPTIKKLFHELLKIRVKPYYLYQCDLVLGSSHFRTSVDKGLEIIKGLRGHTTGYAIPHFVIDAPGGGGKIPLLPEYYNGRNGSQVILSNYQDKMYVYQEPKIEEKRERLLIGIAYDLKEDYKKMGYSNEDIAEFDSPETINAIESSLRTLGYDTERIGNINQLIHKLHSGKKWDLVFNIAEGMHGVSRESQIPNLLDAYNIPYVFSSATIHSLTQHKGLVKHVLNDKEISTPRFSMIEQLSDVYDVKLEYPLFAKPVAEGSSKGIGSLSKVNNPEELYNTVKSLLEQFKQPVLVEEYLPGREFTIGIIGTGEDSRALGALEVKVTKRSDAEIYSYEMKQNYQELVKYNVVNDIDAQKSADLAIRAWKALGCRDGGRIDIRLDKFGEPSLVEINTLAGLNPNDSDLPILCRNLNIPYVDLIKMITDSAIKRLERVKINA